MLLNQATFEYFHTIQHKVHTVPFPTNMIIHKHYVNRAQNSGRNVSGENDRSTLFGSAKLCFCPLTNTHNIHVFCSHFEQSMLGFSGVERRVDYRIFVEVNKF